MPDSSARPDPLTADLLYCTSYAERHPCDCDPVAYHRWNCASTPIWAQTIRDLDTNPWTCITNFIRDRWAFVAGGVA